VPTPQSPHSGDEGESGEGGVIDVSETRGTSIPGPSWRWVSSRAGLRLGVPSEALEGRTPSEVGEGRASSEVGGLPRQEPDNVVRPPAMCDVSGCGERRKYRLVQDFKRGACGMEHLRLLSGHVAG
jgi:hypothetical protein